MGKHKASGRSEHRPGRGKPATPAVPAPVPVPETGVELIRSAQERVRAEPESGMAWLRLAEALERNGHIQSTYQAYIQAFQLAPRTPRVQLALGRFLIERGALDDAERVFRMAAGEGELEAVTGLATVLERRGDVAGALALVERFDAGLEQSFSLRLLKARILLRRREAAAALDLLLGARVPASSLVQTYYYYALGDTHDALGHVDEAFAAWTTANELRQLRYDAAAHTRFIDGLIERTAPATYASRPRASTTDALPVLIVGLPRSGTSLVESILAAHSQVHGAGELDYLKDIVLTANLDEVASLDEGARRYRDRLRALGPGKARVTDKMPHNFLHLGAAGQLLPGARVIHCQRDLLDIGLSIYSKHFNAVHNYATDLQAMAHFFREHQRLMAHWRVLQPLPLFELRYEELVSDPEPIVRRLLEFCELPWEDGVMRFHESSRYVSTASYAQVKQPLYTSALGRAQRYARHLEPLRLALAG